MEFKIKKVYKKARVGILKTAHGVVETPNIAFVATHGGIKLLDKKEHELADPDLMIANTFHLWVNNKEKEIKKTGGINKWNKIKKPFMTDSGGFQVFSLGWGRTHGVGKIKSQTSNTKYQKNQIKISNNGVVFRYDNKKYELTPEESIKIQHNIGADIIFVFDECTSPLHDYKYNQKALKRTHEWAIRSLVAHKKRGTPSVALFGIVQGGVFEKLRKQSSKFIGSLDFDGFGIGGSFGEKQMGKAIEWSLSGLPKEKPRHLLGIGKIKDIFIAVGRGIDLFDCVIPTREARHGTIYTKNGKVDYRKKGAKFYNIYKKDKFKAMHLATIHNIRFYKDLFQKIRKEIFTGRGLKELKREYEVYLN